MPFLETTVFWIAACLPRWRGGVPLEIARLCEAELGVGLDSETGPENRFLSEGEDVDWILSLASALLQSDAFELHSEDAVGQYLLEWMQERYTAQRLSIREWTTCASDRGEIVSQTLSSHLTTGLLAGVSELSGVGWSASLVGCEAELRVDGVADALPLKPRWSVVLDHANGDSPSASTMFSTRAPASGELAVWELECGIPLASSKSSPTVLDGRYTCLLEDVLEVWKLGEYRDAHREVDIGDEIWSLWLSVTQPWQLTRSSLPLRSFFLRRAVVPAGDVSVRDLCRDFVGHTNGNSLLVDRCGSPLAREIGEIIPMFEKCETVVLGRAWPSVSAVRAVVTLPFVDSRRFVLDDDDDEVPNFSVHTDECHDVCVGGQWLPLSPLNEWLLRRGENEVFLYGRWHTVNFSTVTLTDAAEVSESSSLTALGSVAWLKRRNDPVPLRFVCSGVPMSLERRVLKDARAPLAFQNPHVVVVSPSGPPPLAVQRAWQLGDRTNHHVNEYFGLGKPSIGRTPTRGMDRRTERAIEDHRTTCEPRYVSSSGYQYRFPVEVSGEGHQTISSAVVL